MDFLHPDIQAYAERHTSSEGDFLASLNRETHLKVLYPQMLSGHLQGRMLAMFSKMVRPRRILEIGTFTGYSALCLAEGLTEDGKLITLEVDPELKKMATGYFEKSPYAAQIDMRIGSGLEIIPQLDEVFDLVFIDADKYNYINYFNLILPKLRTGGIILADNVLWSGHVLDEAVQDKETAGLRDFAKFVSNDPRVETLLLPVRDGIMVVRKL
ncbi:MAG: O-methyltransferase [Bacteroidia bacterium]|nr:O-methyltransferase [Bacteroidia bacterium]